MSKLLAVVWPLCVQWPRSLYLHTKLVALACLAVAGAGHDASFGAIFKIASCDRMVPGWIRNFLFFRHVIPQELRYTLR